MKQLIADIRSTFKDRADHQELCKLHMSRKQIDKYDSQTFNCLQFGVITNIVILLLWTVMD